MLPTLENSEKFKTEFNNFRERISQITNEPVKKDLNGKLTELLREVRAIDQQHHTMFMSKELPNMIPESRSKLTEVRNYIISKLTDWDRSQLN
jgi:hypothetical protein